MSEVNSHQELLWINRFIMPLVNTLAPQLYSLFRTLFPVPDSSDKTYYSHGASMIIRYAVMKDVLTTIQYYGNHPAYDRNVQKSNGEL